MEQECFEDEEIGRMLNDSFVPIKVDREERPDVDRVYMTFVRVCTVGLYVDKDWPFDAHCRHKGTAIKHPVPDWIEQSFVIFSIRALWRSALSVRVPGCQKLQMTA